MHLNVLCCCLLALILGINDIKTAAAQDVRLSEVHYDNTGTDSGEAIEVSGPAGLSVAGWQVVLYNGNGGNGVTYDTRTLSGSFPATCGARGVMVLNYPANGIQNGGSGAADTTSPDAIALVNASGTVVEFISYEGVVVGTNGPAVGLVSTDIGVRELGTEPVGQSLWRNADGVWSGPAANTFGACNDDGDPNPPAEVVSVTVAPTSATVIVGGTVTFTASALDADSDPIEGVAFTWMSSAPSIATVNANGIATAIAAGDAIITATAPNGISNVATLHVDVAPPSGPPDIRFSEIHYDNAGADVGESIEIEGPAGASLAGFSVVLYNGNGGAMYNTTALSGTIPATCNTRGVVFITYPQDGLQNGSPDGFALVNASGQLVEFLSYEGTFPATNGPAAGVTSTDIVAAQNSAAAGLSLQRNAANTWQSATSSFGACNTEGGGGPGPIGNIIEFTGRTQSEPALPVGFQDQLFATMRTPGRVVIPTTFTWSSETPAIAGIDSAGVMTALSVGTAIIRATAADGTTATYSLPTHIAVAGTTAQYAGNAEFGEPQDGDSSDDFIVRYPQYVASYNPNRGTPNWLSYNIDASHFGAEDRCECFTSDPAWPSTFTHLTTNDYTGAGAFHGYGIDRGHMVRSFDRTTASLDNAVTYYFTNIVPQASDLNQGPWSDLEFVLGDYARLQDKEVYVIAGVAGNKGTIKNEGKIVIPTSTWKVAVIMPRNRGLANIVDYRDVQVIAVNMPNDAGIRNVEWETYKTTVDAIELLTGYDLLALLPDDVENAVESNTQPPIGSVTGPASAAEGDTVAFSASAIDPNGSVVSYEWSFGDGATGTGTNAAHTYTQDGVYAVSVTITDNDGLTDIVTTTITVANVAPSVGDFPGATLRTGEVYTVSGSFTDPGAETWTATVNWGDGSPASAATLTGRNFSLTHTYTTAGTFTVTVNIADDDSTASRSQTVVVTQSAPPQPLAQAKALLGQLVASGKISNLAGALLNAQLIVAEQQLSRGNNKLAVVALRAVLVEIDVLVLLTPLKPADVAALRTSILNVIAAAK